MGAGVKADTVEANKWFMQAAEQEWIDAQFKLASSYLLGRGLPRDTTQAFRWFEAAARLYLSGEHGVTPSAFEAYKWLLIANENKIDLSVLTQQQMIVDIKSLESQLDSKARERARKAAEKTLGRPLSNLARLLQPEM